MVDLDTATLDTTALDMVALGKQKVVLGHHGK